MRIFSSLKFLLAIFCLASLAARAADTPQAKAQAAFANSVLAFAKTQRCTTCHGIDQNPLWAQDDVASAYRLAKTYVDFSDPESSTLVVRSRNRHCGPICGTDGHEMRDAIVQWWENGEKELSGGVPPLKVTAALPIPGDLPTGDKFAPLDWDLQSLGFDGVHFSLEIQKFDDYAYRVRTPRVRTTTQSVRVHGVRLLLNGHIVSGAGDYFFVTQASTVASAPVLSPTAMIVPIDRDSKDELSIAFAEIAWGEPLSCRNLPSFVKDVKPTLEHACANCHRRAQSPAAQAYTMPTNDSEACQSARQRIDATWPGLSPLIAFPLGGSGGHPRILNQSQETKFLRWIGAETGLGLEALLRSLRR